MSVSLIQMLLTPNNTRIPLSQNLPKDQSGKSTSLNLRQSREAAGRWGNGSCSVAFGCMSLLLAHQTRGPSRIGRCFGVWYFRKEMMA